VLLLFLPAAWTPICTTELPALAALRDRFLAEAGTVVAAVTVDNAPANREWARRCGADGVYVLSDFYPHGAVSQAYGAWLPAEGISDRATVIVGPDGNVKYSESVGKFGKRSIPALLRVATQVAGGAPAPAGQVQMPLDLPELFVMSGCADCQAVRAFMRARGLDDKVVVRDVVADRGAMARLLDLPTHGNVPALTYQRQTVSGPTAVVDGLRAIFGLA
jgi:peroxiredoxin